MSESKHQLDSRLHAFVNTLLVAIVLLGVFIGLNRGRMPGGIGGFLAYRVSIKNVLVSGIFLSVSVMAFRVFGLSTPFRLGAFWKELIQIAKACTVASICALLFPLTTTSGAFTARTVVFALAAAIVACFCGRVVSSYLTRRLAQVFRGKRDLIIVGSGPRAAALYEREMASGHSRILGFVDSPNGHPVPEVIQRQMLGGLDELENILMRLPVDEVFIALPAKSCYSQIQDAIAVCERGGVESKYRTDIFEVSLARWELEHRQNTSVVSFKVVPDDYRLIVKRAIDIVGAVFGIIVFGPLMLATALAIKLTSPGPVLFTQERYGLNKRRFRMYKFRTMVVDAEKLQAGLESRNEVSGPVFKIYNDPRITPVGRFLRKTSLDEFPQFLNVLRGEMSLVGPRPLPKRDVSKFDDASLMRRFSVKPGLTCLWQVNGRSNTGFGRWIALDLQYIDEWSLWLDFKILAMTLPAVLSGGGAA